MKFMTKTLMAATLLIAGAAFAAEPTDPNVIARQDLMKTIGMNTKVLGDMAGGKAAYDAAKAAEAKAALIAAAADIGPKYEPITTDPAQETLPAVWTNWDDFVKKGEALTVAATAIDVSSAETIGAGMGAIGGSCKDCHTTYRMK